jgi:hypothetical protein
MARRPDAAELPPLSLSSEKAAPDPELEALPAPRRPGRKLTLAAMAMTALVALAMAWGLAGEAAYALAGGRPLELGNLAHFNPGAAQANRWVHGEALLATSGAIRYGRPLERDTYRLAPVAGNDRVWVQVRVPEGMEGPRFVPPTSFVGRLVPAKSAGLRFAGLSDAVKSVPGSSMPDEAWLLIDGEAPSTTRWALGLMALFLAFAAFNVYGLLRLLRPVRDA